MESGTTLPRWARLLLFLGLLVVAWFALPIAAATVEAVSDRAENWIVVVYIAIVVAIGAAVGALVPSSSTATTARGRALRWAGAGLIAALLTWVVWLTVLAG